MMIAYDAVEKALMPIKLFHILLRYNHKLQSILLEFYRPTHSSA